MVAMATVAGLSWLNMAIFAHLSSNMLHRASSLDARSLRALSETARMQRILSEMTKGSGSSRLLDGEERAGGGAGEEGGDSPVLLPHHPTLDRNRALGGGVVRAQQDRASNPVLDADGESTRREDGGSLVRDFAGKSAVEHVETTDAKRSTMANATSIATSAASMSHEGSRGAQNLPIAVVAYNREMYLQRHVRSVWQQRVLTYHVRCLTSLLSVRGVQRSKITVYQDGFEASTAQVKEECLIGRIDEEAVRPPLLKESAAYIADHYKFILSDVFADQSVEFAIIVEEDMIFAPDFLEFFLYYAPGKSW
eukprot:762435-Hanusia_phi.AAC.5